MAAAAWKVTYPSRRKSVPVLCLHCGVEYRAIAYEISRGGGKFCSRRCQRAYQAKANAEAMRGSLTQAEMNARSRAKTPREVILAQRAVDTAIRNGSLQRGTCEVCGAERVDAHHDDYSKPLDVRWLCRRHHLQLHRGTL